jgi:hypothetical protein
MPLAKEEDLSSSNLSCELPKFITDHNQQPGGTRSPAPDLQSDAKIYR